MPFMGKSKFAIALDEVQEPVTGLLKDLGFKKRGRNYNLALESGFVHVVNFQMGQYPIGKYEIPGLRENLYGKFTINLGVYIPYVVEVEGRFTHGKVIKEYECQIRDRLGCLVFGKDHWWPLGRKARKVKRDVVRLIKDHGLPFLSQYKNYEDVISRFEEDGSLPFHTDGRCALVAGMIYQHLDDFENSLICFDKAAEIAIEDNNKGFGEHVATIRNKLID